ncbi:MAG: sensor histidine kinase [Spirochaetales bacterium]|nr:sensor histidine kinase [Spirochaetales bacterium]
MITNELILNALKYAFDYNTDGVIKVSFNELLKEGYILSVGDNGKALESKNLDKKSSGIGKSLMKALVWQLKGSLEIESIDKYKYFRISFRSGSIKHF